MSDFWVKDKLANIIPQGFGECPEGFDVPLFLRGWLQELEMKSVVDFGCGYGRLSGAFTPEQYVGIDVNPEAVAEAKKRCPEYLFQVADGGAFPVADMYLAYTVFLHLTDDEVSHILKQVQTNYFLVAEILGSEWRRGGDPPVYNREFDEYLKIFHQYGYRLVKEEEKPYARYKRPEYLGKNTDISFLLFRHH